MNGPGKHSTWWTLFHCMDQAARVQVEPVYPRHQVDQMDLLPEQNRNYMCQNTFITYDNTIGQCSVVHVSSSLSWKASSAACSMQAAPLQTPRHIHQLCIKKLLPFPVEVIPNEKMVVRCIMNVTNCTYSLMLGTPLTVHMVDVNGYHFLLCDTCLYSTHS